YPFCANWRRPRRPVERHVRHCHDVSLTLCHAVRVDLVWGVVALTVATFTVLLAVRRVVMVVSGLVFARYVAVGGLAAFSVDRDAADGYTVR
ncbi:hypothetical protein ABTM70_19255, partial [Acinetobacter baumannii]